VLIVQVVAFCSPVPLASADLHISHENARIAIGLQLLLINLIPFSMAQFIADSVCVFMWHVSLRKEAVIRLQFHHLDALVKENLKAEEKLFLSQHQISFHVQLAQQQHNMMDTMMIFCAKEMERDVFQWFLWLCSLARMYFHSNSMRQWRVEFDTSRMMMMAVAVVVDSCCGQQPASQQVSCVTQFTSYSGSFVPYQIKCWWHIISDGQMMIIWEANTTHKELIESQTGRRQMSARKLRWSISLITFCVASTAINSHLANINDKNFYGAFCVCSSTSSSAAQHSHLLGQFMKSFLWDLRTKSSQSLKLISLRCHQKKFISV